VTQPRCDSRARAGGYLVHFSSRASKNPLQSPSPGQARPARQDLVKTRPLLQGKQGRPPPGQARPSSRVSKVVLFQGKQDLFQGKQDPLPGQARPSSRASKTLFQVKQGRPLPGQARPLPGQARTSHPEQPLLGVGPPYTPLLLPGQIALPQLAYLGRAMGAPSAQVSCSKGRAGTASSEQGKSKILGWRYRGNGKKK
jgi:hypothetical protein